MRGLWRCFLTLLLFFALVGCTSEPAPPLIQVTELAPREAEVGDRLEITGAGFPQGRPARVALRGALHRPGAASVSRAEVVVTGTVTSPRRIEVAYDEALEAELCSSGGKRLHTTFEGDVEVSFPAVVPGAPPVAAVLHGMTLDLRPPTAPAALENALAEGEKTLAQLGLTLTARGSGGFLVEAVAPGSRAEQAGVQVGDAIVSFDRLRVTSKADFLPRPGRVASLGILRGDEGAPLERDIVIDGLSSAPSDELALSFVLVLAAVALLLAFYAPAEHAAPFERRAALALRASPWAARIPRGALAVAIVWSLVSLVLPGAGYLVSADLDVFVLMLCALAAAIVSTVARGDLGLRPALAVLGREIVGWLAIAAVLYASGSLRLHDLVRAQGALPWRWQAFRDPGTLALLGVFMVVGVAATFREGLQPPSPRVRSLLAAVDTWNAFARAAVASALFLGGWQLPPGWRDAGLAALAAGGLLFVAKTWVLVAVAAVLRAALGRALGRFGRVARVVVPLTFVAACVCVVWSMWAPADRHQVVVGVTLFGASLVIAGRVLHRVRFFWLSSARDGRLDMFA
jgi:NADH-quinone oxidoreductase subunit H